MPHETVSAMIERGAKIKWFCEVGRGHSGEVDLKAVAKAKGGDVTLVNRRPFCKIPGCPGRVHFEDLSSAWPKRIDTVKPPQDAHFEYSRAESARLKALGYRMVQGYWVAPRHDESPPPEGSGPR